MRQHKDLLIPPSRHSSILHTFNPSTSTQLIHTKHPFGPSSTINHQPSAINHHPNNLSLLSNLDPIGLDRLVTHWCAGIAFCPQALTHSTEITITQDVVRSSILGVGLHTSSTHHSKNLLIPTAQEAEDEHHANLLPRSHRPWQALQGGCPV